MSIPNVRNDEHLSKLTTFSESAPVATSQDATVAIVPQHFDNPYDPVDMKQFLERKYQVAEYEWVPADDPFVNLVEIAFPDALLAIPSLNEKLRRFRYLKADIEYEVRINATPFHVGALSVSHLPGGKDTPLDLNARSAQQRTGNNASIITASSVNAASGVLPMLYPAYIDMGEGSTTVEGRIGKLYVDTMTTLTAASAGTVSPVSISVFASFKNIEVAGYTTTDIVTFDTSYVHPFHKEAREKSEKGIITSASEAVSDIAPLFKALPFVGSGAALASGVMDLVKPVFGAMGLSKPLSMQAVQPVVIREGGDLCNGRGLDFSRPMGLDPEAALHALKNPHVLETIQDYIRRPILVAAYDLTDPLTNTILVNIPVTPGFNDCNPPLETWYDSFVGFMARFFKYWRGGIKYRFMFVASKFTTARFRIMHLPMGDAAGDPEATAGDVPSAVVDVRGDTFFDFVAPHLARTEYLPTKVNTETSTYDDTSCNGTVQVSLVNKIVNPDASVPGLIHLLVFASAAEDFEFSQYRSLTVPIQYTWDTSLIEAFRPAFKGLAPAHAQPRRGTSSSESYSSLNSLFKRYCRQESAQDGLSTEIDVAATTPLIGGVLDATNIEAFLKTVRAYRGSVRGKIYTASNIVTLRTLYANSGYAGERQPDISSNGQIRGFASSNWLEFSVPYFNTVPYYLTKRNNGEEDFDEGSSADFLANDGLWTSIGEDFQFLYAAAPPMLTYVAPAPVDTTLSGSLIERVRGLTREEAVKSITAYVVKPEIKGSPSILPREQKR
jgi:hypothetical protein